MPYSILHSDATKSYTVRRDSIDLTVTSPPYNLGKEYDGTSEGDALAYEDYLEFSRKWLTNVYQWTRNTGRLCVNVGLSTNKFGRRPLTADITRIALECGWKYHVTIIWNNGNVSRRTAWGSWKSASAPNVMAPVETIIVFYKGEWKRENQGENDITGDEFKDWVLGSWTFKSESAKRVGHEAPFPRELPKRCIKLFSFKGDRVLDPFAGSGTTILEALCNDREAVGVEIEKRYCDLISNRLTDFVMDSVREENNEINETSDKTGTPR